MNTKDLLDRYLAGPAKLRQSLQGLSEDNLRYKYDPAKWSAKEIAIHVADMDLVAAFRMKRIMAEPNAEYPSVDHELWAQNLGYQGRDPEPALRLLELIRQELGQLLAALPAANWNRRGIHNTAGEQTLTAVLKMYTEHLETHVEQIMAIRRRLNR